MNLAQRNERVTGAGGDLVAAALVKSRRKMSVDRHRKMSVVAAL
jgi:hypothetical protein